MKTITKLSGLALAASLAACAGVADDEAAANEQAVGGVEFVTVAVPGQDCNSIVLRGTRRFQGRAYVLPQAYVGVDANAKPLFQILRNGDGTYAVRLGIYFPGGNGDREQRADNNRRIRPDCTYDRIREVVNASAPENEKINAPTPLVVNHIKAKLADFEGTAMIGHEGTDILSYIGQDAIVEFKITTEAQLRDFLTRLRGNIGVQINFDFVFNAQTTDNFEATVDFRSNADKLDAAFAASSVPAGGAMLETEFKSRLARAMETMKIDAYVESSSGAFRQFADRVLQDLVLSNPAIRIAPPVLPDGQAATSDKPEGREASPNGNLPKIKVGAALEALKAQATFTTKLTSIGEASERTYTAHTVIRANFTEPGVSELSLYSDDVGELFAEDVSAGTSLFIVPSGRTTEDLEYHYRSTDFTTKDDLYASAHNMDARFALLLESPRLVRYPGDAAAYMYRSTFNLFDWSYYTWGFETLVTSAHNRQFSRFEAGQIATLDQVGVTFSRIGRPYTFSQLAEERTAWEADLQPDKNRIRITAKQDLGRLKLENTEHFETSASPTGKKDEQLFERRYYQDYWSSFGAHVSRTYSTIGSAKQLPAKRSLIHVKVIPEHGTLQTISQGEIEVDARNTTPIFHPPPAPPQRQPEEEP